MLDDGLQNPTLAQDLRIVVIDGESGFGNGRGIPAGPLRERVERGLARADAVVLIGEDRGGVAARVPPGKPVLRARIEPRMPGALAGTRVLGFAGIGRPEKFRATLAAAGAEIAAFRAFADHHPFGAREACAAWRRTRTHGRDAGHDREGPGAASARLARPRARGAGRGAVGG